MSMLTDDEQSVWIAAAVSALTGTATAGSPKHHAIRAGEIADTVVNEFRDRRRYGIDKR